MTPAALEPVEPDCLRRWIDHAGQSAEVGRGVREASHVVDGDTWIAKWRDGGRQVQRGLGFAHSKKHPNGLTLAEAEAALGTLVPKGARVENLVGAAGLIDHEIAVNLHHQV